MQALPDEGILATAVVFTLITAAVIVAIAGVAGCCCRGEPKRAQPAGLTVLASPGGTSYFYAPALGNSAAAAGAAAPGSAAAYAAAPRAQPAAIVSRV